MEDPRPEFLEAALDDRPDEPLDKIFRLPRALIRELDDRRFYGLYLPLPGEVTVRKLVFEVSFTGDIICCLLDSYLRLFLIGLSGSMLLVFRRLLDAPPLIEAVLLFSP